jgi:NAD(P)H-flavin reductase
MHGTFASLALVLACFHATCLVPYLALPIACGAFDRLFAWARASSEHKCKLTALSQGTAVRLQVDSVRWRQRVQPGQWAYVKLENPLLPHVPGHALATSLPGGWHPLSIVSVPASASGGAESCGPVTFVAAGSAFAMAAAAAATETKGATPQSCFARVDGPYGRPAVPRAVAARLRSLLIVAGGAGITPCLPCAFDMASHLGRGLTAHTASNAAGLLPPPTVALLWAVRRSDALSTWFPGVLERLAAAGVRVTCAVTGEVDDTDSQLHDLTAAGVTLLRGRPDVGAAVRQAVASNASTSAVFVCGPSSLTSAVETAAAAEGVPCYAECFTA